MTPFEKYLQHLDSIFQVEPQFFSEKSFIEGAGNVASMVYADIPEPGMVTGLTYGLSTVSHPDWKMGRPELSICVQSKDIIGWGVVIAYLANRLRGEFNFAYGSTIPFRERIADDSEMDAFFIFAPSIFDQEDYLNIDIGLDYKINLKGVYPIYDSEIEVISKIGIENFLHHPGFDMYDVQRKVIHG